jgi:hypothetical protein
VVFAKCSWNDGVEEDEMDRACSTKRVILGRPEGKNHQKDSDLGWRIILKWIYRM